jgi:hypothetical protein
MFLHFYLFFATLFIEMKEFSCLQQKMNIDIHNLQEWATELGAVERAKNLQGHLTVQRFAPTSSRLQEATSATLNIVISC